MGAIKAHFDGRVFVPDEPVRLRPGQQVMVQQVGSAEAGQKAGLDVSFVRKLNIDLDADSLGGIVNDPELGIENF